MSNIKDVAAAAGVSIATVSRVLNNTGFVSEDRRQRVLSVIDALGYQPNGLAQGMRLQLTSSVGVVVPQLDQPFFSALAYHIEKTLFAEGYRTFICSAEEHPGHEAAYLDMLLRQRVDGLILVPTGHGHENLERLRAQGVPFVTVDRVAPDVPGHAIVTENYEGTRDLTEHLVGLGHTRFGVISPPTHSGPVQQRLNAIRDVLEARGLISQQVALHDENLAWFDLGRDAARTLLTRTPRPTAVMALTDVMAVGVLHAAHDLGLRVPEDLSVTGFDDIPLASHALPGLTTVAQPFQEMGRRAASRLLDLIRRPDLPPETERLPARLVVRGSTAAPPQEDR